MINESAASITAAPAIEAVDACAFHDWPGTTTLTPFMDSTWRRMMERSSDPFGPARIKVKPLYPDPRGPWAPDTYPESGMPGTDFDTFRRQLLDDSSLSHVVLGYDEAFLVTAIANHYIGQQVTNAVNVWTEEEWLGRDPRLLAYILISSALPEEAAKEIRRAARNERMVGVHLGANVLGKPLGHPIYHPIYQAAADHGLPLVLQVGCDGNAPDLFTAPPGGPIATSGEYQALGARPLASHVVSMIAQGVFEKFKELKVLLIGGGVAWVPDALWRADYRFKSMSHEIPWLRRQPSEYFVDHVRMTTYGFEVPDSSALGPVLRSVPGLDSTIVYASGYPNRDWQKPSAVASLLGEFASDQVFRRTAMDLLGVGSDTSVAPKED
ncbi:amidohydrolase family protein [Rhodococcus koreensis]